MKSKLFVAALVFAATSTAAFANGGGARGGVYPATTTSAAMTASNGAVVNSGFGGAVSATSESGKARVPSAGVAGLNSTANLFRHH
ncbi:hypothetical protein G3A43_06405 [Paraburkholderia aspalathi]|nr:hypothetical protein [Paraburkholderia aspalathi]MBK3779880.1 hypothetical protein [Paraburkholderia aspalathi]